ncbi:MAG: rod-binding protein [Armatimonadota bacterium]|nr:rod-binding protein [Armatimonadota bacterium]
MRIDNLLSKSKPNATLDASSDQKLRKACKDFESILIHQLLTIMRQSVPKADLFGDRREEEFFNSMLDEEIAKQISQRNSLGIADILYSQLSKAQNKKG